MGGETLVPEVDFKIVAKAAQSDYSSPLRVEQIFDKAEFPSRVEAISNYRRMQKTIAAAAADPGLSYEAFEGLVASEIDALSEHLPFLPELLAVDNSGNGSA